MAVKGGLWLEKVRRCIKTVYFMVTMLSSLLMLLLPVVVAIADAVLPCLLISSFSCVKCYTFREHLQRYSFKSSLMDIPLVSIIRSLVIICVYMMCNGPVLTLEPYLGTVTVCSLVSMLMLSVKACVFSVHSQLETEASTSLSRKRLHLKKSWGMPVLFLSSVVFALGHIVVAYRTSCKARRKLIFHRDPEAGLSCKIAFSGYQKVPRSPTPAGKSSRSDSEPRRKLPGLSLHDGELPVSLLADRDSLFVSCQGLTVHYKLHLPGSPSHCLSSIHLFDLPSLNTPTKTQYSIRRSISNQFCNSLSPLDTPLLASSPTSPISEDMPILSLNESSEEDEHSKLGSPLMMGQNGDTTGQFGIVLVHGFGGGVFSWRKIMGDLSRETGCAVAAFDRPGWGLTSRPRKKDWEENQLPNPYKLDSQVDLLLSFCSEMFSSVVLVGHNDGGLLALKAVQKLQSSGNLMNLEMKGLVLLDTSLSKELVPAFARILLRTSLGKKHMVRPLLRTEITQVVNRQAWYDATKLTTDVLSLYKAPLHVDGWDEALQEIGKLSHETVLPPQTAAMMLKAVEMLPVLVISGAEDSLVPLESVQTLASKLLNSRMVAISGCGHLPHEECPKALLAAILPFINRLLLRPESQKQ